MKRSPLHIMSKTSLGLALASLLVSGSAFADEFHFLSPGTVIWNGVFVNTYLADNITNPAENPLKIYCDDWNTDFSGTPTWTANVYTLTAGNLSNFKYGIAPQIYNVNLNLVTGYLSVAKDTAPAWSPFQRYLEAAWLDQEWETLARAGGVPAVLEDQQRKISAAMWTLFVDDSHVGALGDHPTDGLIGAINNTGFAVAVDAYLGAAQHAVTPIALGGDGYTAPGWDVIVPVGRNSNSQYMQEFLVHDNTVPEPGSVILLGTVAGFLAFTKFRHKRQA
jgi:hypothetical protein